MEDYSATIEVILGNIRRSCGIKRREWWKQSQIPTTRARPLARPSPLEQFIKFEPNGFNKPIDVRFHSPEMFIVDFGVFAPATPIPN
jgi:hypothetical protein